jgi:hypothetical protein
VRREAILAVNLGGCLVPLGLAVCEFAYLLAVNARLLAASPLRPPSTSPSAMSRRGPCRGSGSRCRPSSWPWSRRARRCCSLPTGRRPSPSSPAPSGAAARCRPAPSEGRRKHRIRHAQHRRRRHIRRHRPLRHRRRLFSLTKQTEDRRPPPPLPNPALQRSSGGTISASSRLRSRAMVPCGALWRRRR